MAVPRTILLTLNSGSTSVKLAAFEFKDGRIASSPLARERMTTGSSAQRQVNTSKAQLLSAFLTKLGGRPLIAIAHRVVHGGSWFTAPVLINAAVQTALEELSALAPLHNPVALEWLHVARETCEPEVAQIAVFDTAFFAQLPRVAREYALPTAISAVHGVRRYGFHGLAHQAMWQRWCARHPQLPRGGRLITVQLGGGCSIAAIHNGQPMDTSMGFSPLEGLMMATRAGDIDPAVVPYLAQRLRCPAEEVIELLNEKSGLLGVSGLSADIWQVLQHAGIGATAIKNPGDTASTSNARFAVELYCHRVRKYIGAYLAVLGGCDGIVFGGGVGENVPEVRARILNGMHWAGIALDANANAGARGVESLISAAQSRVRVCVIPVDEERVLAQAAAQCLTPPA